VEDVVEGVHLFTATVKAEPKLAKSATAKALKASASVESLGSVSELTENLTLAERLAAKSGKGKAAKKVRPPPPPAPPPPP
jgi:hypothetical protein